MTSSLSLSTDLATLRPGQVFFNLAISGCWFDESSSSSRLGVVGYEGKNEFLTGLAWMDGWMAE